MTITTALPPRPAAEATPTGGAGSRTGNAPAAGAAAFADALHSAPAGAAAGATGPGGTPPRGAGPREAAADPAPSASNNTTATPDPERALSAADATPLADVPAETPAANPLETSTGAVVPTATPTVTPGPTLQGLAFPLALPGQAAGGAGAESALPTSAPTSVPVPAPASAPLAAAALAAAPGTPPLGSAGTSATTGSPAAAAAVAATANSVAVPTGTPTPRTAAAAAAAAITAAADSAKATSPTAPSSIPLGVAPSGATTAQAIGTAHGDAPATVTNVVPTPVAVPSAASTAAATPVATTVTPETVVPDAGIPTPTSGERGTASGAWPLGPVATPGSAPVASAPPVPATPAAGTPLASQVVRPLFTLATAGPGEHTLSISVTPDNLGPVVVRAQISASGMRLELFAPTELARDALRLILPDLRRDLAGGGLPASLDLSTRSQPGEAGFSGRHDRPAPDLAGHGGAGFGGEARGSQDGSRDPAAVNPWLRAASAGLDATGPPDTDTAGPTSPGTTGRVDVLA